MEFWLLDHCVAIASKNRVEEEKTATPTTTIGLNRISDAVFCPVAPPHNKIGNTYFTIWQFSDFLVPLSLLHTVYAVSFALSVLNTIEMSKSLCVQTYIQFHQTTRKSVKVKTHKNRQTHEISKWKESNMSRNKTKIQSFLSICVRRNIDKLDLDPSILEVRRNYHANCLISYLSKKNFYV